MKHFRLLFKLKLTSLTIFFKHTRMLLCTMMLIKEEGQNDRYNSIRLQIHIPNTTQNNIQCTLYKRLGNIQLLIVRSWDNLYVDFLTRFVAIGHKLKRTSIMKNGLTQLDKNGHMHWVGDSDEKACCWFTCIELEYVFVWPSEYALLDDLYRAWFLVF